MTGRKLSIAYVRAQLAKLGMVLRKYDGEYRVSFGEKLWDMSSKRREDTAYYTEWIDDALQTGLKMAEDEIRHKREG